MHGEEAAIGPVEGEEGFAIFIGEIAFGAKLDAGRRADANVHDGPQAVRVIFRPIGRTGAPAVFSPGDAMNDARGTIPWQAPIPFHVAIEREHLAVRTEIEIIRI